MECGGRWGVFQSNSCRTCRCVTYIRRGRRKKTSSRKERENHSYGETQKQAEQFAIEMGERRNMRGHREAKPSIHLPECIKVTGSPSNGGLLK